MCQEAGALVVDACGPGPGHHSTTPPGARRSRRPRRRCSTQAVAARRAFADESRGPRSAAPNLNGCDRPRSTARRSELYRRLPVKARRRVVRTIAPAYTVGAICVIERADGAVLLVRLTYRNSWGLPGGLLKRGETPERRGPPRGAGGVGLEVELLGDPAVVVDAAAQRVDVVFRARPAAGRRPRRRGRVVTGDRRGGWFPARRAARPAARGERRDGGAGPRGAWRRRSD